MADVAKYTPIGGGGAAVSDLKTHLPFLKTRRTVTCAYAFMFAFIAFTIFMAFSPSSNSSSPWFSNIFSTSSSSTISSNSSYRSHFSSVFSYFFPSSSTNPTPRSQDTTPDPTHLSKEPPGPENPTRNETLHDKAGILNPSNQSTLLPPNYPVGKDNHTDSSAELNKGSPVAKNQTQSKQLQDKVGILKSNLSSIGETGSNHTAISSSGKKNATGSADKRVANLSSGSNQTANSSSGQQNITGSADKRVAEKGVVGNFSSALLKGKSNGTNSVSSAKQGSDDLVKSLVSCDFFDGNWVRDESYPLYKPGSCSLIDEQFNCFRNGRPDSNYYKLKWKPKGCSLPRLNASHMLEMLTGKRLVFVGDSLNRNMWESLVCILRDSVKNQAKVYEEFGRNHFRAEASYSFIFEDYKCRVEFFASPFLVREWEIASKNKSKKETLRLDLIGETADKYKNADIIVFNTGHWWTHEKTSLGKDYYQEGSHVYNELNVLEAFRKALTTWGRWVDANINPMKTLVFFRGYSASHFSGGRWNTGGQCDHQTEPIKNESYLSHYPSKMKVLERVMKGMKTRATYLNITRMTDYRKDGHPSMYRKQHLSEEERRSPLRFQDCSHWCLPGVPDAWNELLYAELLVKQYQQKQKEKRP